MSDKEVADGRRRVVIDKVEPAVDRGRFPIKRTVGDTIAVTADIFADGHDCVACELLYRKLGETEWQTAPLRPNYNDRWDGEFTVDEVGRYQYTVEAWVDHFESWVRDLKKRLAAGQNITVDLAIGADLIAQTVERAVGEDALWLAAWQQTLRAGGDAAERLESGGDDELAAIVRRYPDKQFASRFDVMLEVIVDRVRARFSSWYELFPRSTATEPGRHGTLADCAARLPYIASMGFDVLYLPPIHPIGTAFRKGKNNAVTAAPGEPGSPWAIGSPEGGHTAIHSELGTLDDLHNLITAAGEHGIDIALDIAFQCSPDHPYVEQHPSWFRARPDGTVQYAENPPKKYQDIYPFDFESEDWRSLWEELKNVILYWCRQGVSIFRVDNPHTKPFAFWEWLIAQVKAEFPETIFLAEAFTRPKIMVRLAKLGFSQSYTYFTWRNSKAEFTEYLTELTHTGLQEFFRTNFWPNTPDILPDHLQHGGPAAFRGRLVLAATLSSNYGIYGPVYELGEHVAREPGSEEYLNSEKYEVRHWDLAEPNALRELITRMNRIRRENPALQSNDSLRFHLVENDRMLCYSKRHAASGNAIVVVANLDYAESQVGFITLPLAELGLAPDRPYEARDLLGDTTFTWQGERNYVQLDPQQAPAHVLLLRQL